MINIKSFCIIIFLSFSVLVNGYNKPNSIAFDSKTKSYFISNNKGKTITLLDSNYNKNEIITGLTSPKDLLFATFGSYKGLLVLDSNQVKVFEADSFKLIATFNVSGAIDLEDGEADKTKSNIFYISDPKAHKIFKVEIGGAPLYIPTFSTLCNFRNAKALLFDSKNRLLCTTDTTQSQVYIVNTSTGNKSLFQTTDIDYINSIEEDFEGNFYATSWGDSYVYRLDKNFKNSKGLIVYSKPTGLFFNKMYDLLAIACSNCNKVEFYKLHMVYIENSDTIKCPDDSFYVNANIQYKGIGTYNQGNIFYVEISDSKGNFNSPLKIGMANSISELSSYKATLPGHFRFYGNSYKIRIKSTNPVFYSINEINVNLPYVPFSDFFDKDTIKYCTSNKIVLGKKINTDDTLLCNYSWYEDGKKVQNSNTFLDYKKTGNHKYLLNAEPKSNGCTVSDSVFLLEYIKIKIPYSDTVIVCQKSEAIIGGDSINNTTINWFEKSTLYNYGTKFKFYIPWQKGNQNSIYTAIVKSNVAECTDQKDIYLFYKNLPQFSLNNDTFFKICTGTSVNLDPKFIEGDTQFAKYIWTPQNRFNNPFNNSVYFTNEINIDSIFKIKFSFSDSVSKCQDSLSCKIVNFQKPEKPALIQISNTKAIVKNYNSKFQYQYEITRKDNSIINGDLTDSVIVNFNSASSKYIVIKVSNQNLCDTMSDTLFLLNFNKIITNQKYPIEVFPNPSSDIICIKSLNNNGKKIKITIFDISGRDISTKETAFGQNINISDLEIGYYYINITFENNYYNTVLIKK
ncbi:MAG: T9SS type A sorting domain-containing protein [Bacteroidia bacterium]|nr:T9SS type A sorting domain-containing protein [Bacteroidia bacterium]